MGSASALAIRLIDNKKLGTPLTILDTGESIQGVIKVNRVASRPDNREYLEELIVSSATPLTYGQVVQATLSGERHLIVSLANIDARNETAVRVALLMKVNCICDVYEYAPPAVDEWGQPTGITFRAKLSNVYGVSFTALPGEDQKKYGSRPDGIFTVVISKTVASTYRPMPGDRIRTTDLSDGFVRTWQIDLVDPDAHGQNAYKMVVSEDVRV